MAKSFFSSSLVFFSLFLLLPLSLLRLFYVWGFHIFFFLHTYIYNLLNKIHICLTSFLSLKLTYSIVILPLVQIHFPNIVEKCCALCVNNDEFMYICSKYGENKILHRIFIAHIFVWFCCMQLILSWHFKIYSLYFFMYVNCKVFIQYKIDTHSCISDSKCLIFFFSWYSSVCLFIYLFFILRLSFRCRLSVLFSFYLVVNLATVTMTSKREAKELKIKKTSRYNSRILYVADESSEIIYVCKFFLLLFFFIPLQVFVFESFLFFFFFVLRIYFIHALNYYVLFFSGDFYFARFQLTQLHLAKFDVSDEIFSFFFSYLTQMQALLLSTQSWNRKYNIKKKCVKPNCRRILFFVHFFFLVYFFLHHNFRGEKRIFSRFPPTLECSYSLNIILYVNC